MSYRRGISAGALAAFLIASASTVVVPVAGQAPTPTAATPTYTPPRTPWGDPDLRGVWDFQNLIPLERPGELAGKAVFTDEELAQWVKKRTPNDRWNTRNFVRDNRTSLIVDPPDGRIPLTPEGRKRYAALEEYRRLHQHAYDTWEESGSYERCISRVMPRLYQGYNSGTLIVQSPGWVVFVYEQLDTRIIPLDGRPHIDSNIRQWNGDSVGHWEGNTLVVDTTNFTDKQTGWPPFSDHGKWRDGPGRALDGAPDQLGQLGVPQGTLHLIERYTPVAANRIDYYATSDDPTWFSKPWTVMLPWQKDETYQLYEYACNEGNLSVENALRGARVQEKERAEEAAKKAKPGSK